MIGVIVETTELMDQMADGVDGVMGVPHMVRGR